MTHTWVMKGRYNGYAMNIYYSMPGYKRLANNPRLSKEGTRRLKWFDYYNSHRHNARRTCRHFDISPQTLYRRKKRYNPEHIESLEDRSHRPRHVRQPTYSVELVEAVLRLRYERVQSLVYITPVEYIEKKLAKIPGPVLPMWLASI